jgi:spermidine synthase
MRLVDDPKDPSGKYLILDTLQHSYVDLDNPKHLEFWYADVMAKVMNSAEPAQDIRMLTIGGGGFTLPRYVAATRSQSQTTSLEIDPQLVRFNRERLDLNDVERLQIRIGDARSTIATLQPSRFDVVVADAFGSESVPWQLTTLEFHKEVHRVTKDTGLLVFNIIDFRTRDLLRAELKTLQRVWPYVSLIERRQNGEVTEGNFVVVAANRSIRTDGLVTSLATSTEPSVLVDGAELNALTRNAALLTDDYAPADQLLDRNLPD